MDEDKIINKLIEIDEKLVDMATRSDLRELKDEINTRLDEQSVILKRIDEERYFMVDWVRRIETDVQKIKTHLQIA